MNTLLCSHTQSYLYSASLQLTSELFYGDRLKARAHPGRHPVWPPVSVFSARGSAVQTNGDTGYYNDDEVSAERYC